MRGFSTESRTGIGHAPGAFKMARQAGVIATQREMRAYDILRDQQKVEQAAQKAAELALMAEVVKGITIVELDAYVDEKEKAMATALGQVALQEDEAGRELVGAN